MKKILFSFIAILIVSCSKDSNSTLDPLNFIDNDIYGFITIKNLDSFQSSLKRNDLYSKFVGEMAKNELLSALEFTNKLDLDENIIVGIVEHNSEKELVLIHKMTTNFKNNIPRVSELKHLNHSYSKFETDIYAAEIDSVFIASSSEDALKHCIENNTKEIIRIAALKKLLSVENSDINTTIYLNTKESSSRIINILELTKKSNDEGWIAIEANEENEFVAFNGTYISSDSIPSNKTLSNVVTQGFSIANAIPEDPKTSISFSFEDFQTFNESFFNNTSSKEILSDAVELGIAKFDEVDLVAIKLNTILDDSSLSKLESHRNHNIYENTDISIPKKFPILNLEYLTILDEYILLSDTKEAIKLGIEHYENQAVLANQNYFTALTDKLGSAGHILITENLESDNKKSINTAHQVTFEKDFTLINTVVSSFAKKPKSGINQAQNITLDNNIILAPQLVKNHRTNNYEIITQDQDNNLHLISSDGKALWKKQLDGPILGNIKQVDIYKNNKLQYAFCTSKTFYIIDRNGNHIDNFPVSFKDDITQPLAVFDYDKNKRYRFIITQSNEVLMLDKTGKRVKGFQFSKTNNTNGEGIIQETPKHFRIGNKDFIVINADKEGIYFLDRTGKTRLTKEKSHAQLADEMFFYDNTFSFVDVNGNLYNKDAAGNTTKKEIPFLQEYHAIGESDLLVLLKENNLSINNRLIELPFGQYTKPIIFSLNKKKVIAITDLEGKKVYLYNTEGKLLPKLPVYGNSIIDIVKDKGNNKLVVQGENNSILVYTIN